MSKKNRSLTKAVILSGLLIVSSQVGAVTINRDYSAVPVSDLAGISTYLTHGDDMDGMRVTATFSDQSTDYFDWSDNLSIAGSGGGVGTSNDGWGLSVTGDTYNAKWNFINRTGLALTGLMLDATFASTYVVFDMVYGSVGTPGSADGGDFFPDATTSYGTPIDGTVTYSHEVGLIGDILSPYHDLWYKLSFAPTIGLTGDWGFYQDTDNDLRYSVPEPSGIALIVLGLCGIGFMQKRIKC